jgi:hypothetical protein
MSAIHSMSPCRHALAKMPFSWKTLHDLFSLEAFHLSAQGPSLSCSNLWPLGDTRSSMSGGEGSDVAAPVAAAVAVAAAAALARTSLANRST